MEEILQSLKKACIEISEIMRNTNSISLSKLTEENNESGDDVKSLDLLSNTILKNHLSKNKYVEIIGSEEEEELIYLKDRYDLEKKKK